MTYAIIYGADRMERASRMVRNIPPIGAPMPPVGVFNGIRFTKAHRYVEDLDLENLPERNYFVVRSQKFGTRYRWRTTYKVYTRAPLQEVFAVSPLNYASWSCSCRDPKVCKHIFAVVRTYSTYRFRF